MNRLAENATIKQENFINRLLRERANLNALRPAQVEILDRMKAEEQITKDDASYLIKGLLECDKKDMPKAQPGYYIGQHGQYLHVVPNKKGDRTYAKVLDVQKKEGQRAKAKWTYAPGEAALVAHLTPLSLEEATKFGHLNGVCIVCCRALTDPESVKAGIGPVCAKKFGAPKPKQEEIVVNPKGRAMRR